MLSSRSALRRASAVHSGSIPCVPVREYASAEAETTPLRRMTPILPPAPILPSVPITATTPTTNITHMTTTATPIPKTILAVLDMATPLPNYPGERLPSAHFQHHPLHRLKLRRAAYDGSRLINGHLRILESVPCQHGNNDLFLCELIPSISEQPGNTRRRRRFAEDTFVLCQKPLGLQNLLIGHITDCSSRLPGSLQGLFSPGGITNPDGCGYRLRLPDYFPPDQGVRTLRLKAPHYRQPSTPAHVRVFPKTLPVRSDVSRVAHRNSQEVGSCAKGIHQFKGRCLLSLYPVRIQGSDQGYWVLVCYLLDELKGQVKVAINGDRDSPMHQRLRQLAKRNLPLGDKHRTLHSRSGCIRSSSSRRIPGGSTYDCLRSLLHGSGHSHGHTPVFEGARRVSALELEVGATADLLTQPLATDKRCASLKKRHGAGILPHGKKLTVPLYQPGILHRTLMVVRALRQHESPSTSLAAAKKYLSRVGWVISTSSAWSPWPGPLPLT